MIRRLLVADAVRDHTGVLGDAVLVAGGSIVDIGDAATMRSADLAEERFPGGTIVAGLRDAHLHPVGHAAALYRPVLKNARDFADVADILTDAAVDLPPGSALTGLRLDDESLAEGRLPDRHLLDRISTERPILLVRYCGHVAVANSKALELAGLTDASPDPRGGSMDRDASGHLTGVLRETATESVTEAIRSLAPPVTADHLVSGAHGLASVGITGVGAMASTEPGCWAGADSEVDSLIEAGSRLPIPMSVMVIARDVADLEAAAERLAAAGPMLRFGGLKVFSDGSLGGHTAAMHHGFADAPDQTGTDRLDHEWCLRLARQSLELGGRVAIHAIGDRANSGVLDLMERLIADGADPGMLRIEHASVLTADDIARFGRLGVTASVQPAFMASETEWLEKRVGKERLERTYPLRSLRDAGAPLAGGSDCPVEPPHPLWGMAAARDRCGIVPRESLDAEDALALFTVWAAAAIGEDGALRPGAPASLTVLADDPVTASPDRLRETEVLATIVEGTEVHVPEGTVAWKG